MSELIKSRVLQETNHILETKETIRQTAKYFNLSKSTVHYDVSNRLKDINFILFLKIKSILFKNFNEKHIRGGKTTAKKYMENI